jgi:1,4-dihydroxy-2-naphthoate octaprenyltransferase
LSKTQYLQIFAAARPRFLILTPCCLLPAVACVIAEGVPINNLNLILIFIAALAAHMSVNLFNEWEDFTSELDLHTQRTPFSGGSGTLPAYPEMADAVRAAAIISLSITIAIGLFLVGTGGWYLALIGLLGIGLIYFYTSKITHHAWLCLIAPGLAFGPLMMGGAYMVLGGQNGLGVFMVSLVVFFLVNNLLLLNQFPDLEADKCFGRIHLPILIGRQNAAWFFVVFLVAAYLVLLIGIWLKILPVYSLLGGLTVLMAVPAANKVIQHAEYVELLKPTMALNVAITLATPVLVSIGIFLSGWF